VDQRCVADLGSVKLLARHSGADNGEDAGADDCSDAESGKGPGAQGLLQRMFGIFRLADQLIDGFAGKQLIGQGGSPVIARGPVAGMKPFGEVYMVGRACGTDGGMFANREGKRVQEPKSLRAATDW